MASKKQKLLALRDREHRLREQQVLDAQLQRNFERLKSEVGGFARPGTKASAPAIRKKARAEEQSKRFGTRYEVGARLPAKADPAPRDNLGPRYTGDMARREAEALEQTKLLQNRVAPLGNKMGNQYMTDSDLADFKKGLLRRRS